MLTNYAAGLPLDRLHNMLRLFCVNPKFDKWVKAAAATGRTLTDLYPVHSHLCHRSLSCVRLVTNSLP